MHPRLEIRPATPADAETLHRFISELAAFEREPDAVEATPASLREQMESPRPPFESLVAELDGEPAGFALFFHNYSTWRGRHGVYLEDLYVTPAHRRKGVARALFRRLAELALERGCGRLELAVLDWNRNAIDFYRSIGGKPLDEWTIYRLTDRELKALEEEGYGPGTAAEMEGS
jgi:GNAT superfamily N-acetyltransferase